MNGPHDLGGRMGFGPVAPEVNEPLFHADWEARSLGLSLAFGSLRLWSIDESRFARESLPPAIYANASYYEIWARGLESLVVKHGLVNAEDLARGSTDPLPPHARRMSPQAVPEILARGGPADRPIDTPPKFTCGARVRTKLMNPKTHTRLPQYLTGKYGVIDADHGGHVFPDSRAQGLGENPQRLYTVVFDGVDVWGEDAEPGLSVSADLWSPILTTPEAPFDAPWQAQAFGLTVALHEQGVFDWPTWAQALSVQLRKTDAYWDAWLAALEGLLAERGLAQSGQIAALAEQWQDAAHATPHGQPILLENAQISGS